MDVRSEVLAAEKRIREHIRETPLEYSSYLSRLSKSNVYLKLENLQITNSFKFRGAMNKILFLLEQGIQEGFITASSGNHGAAFAYGLKKLGLQGTIILPENASKIKIEALRDYDVDLRFHGTDCVDAEIFAKETAKNANKQFISPYNDPQIIGGQGTIGVELERQLDELDAVFVQIGGGGLISGIAGYLKSTSKNTKIIGCQPTNSRVMYESVKADNIIDMKSEPTLSDGTAGGIEPGSVTFDICKKYVDEYILIEEKEIIEAVRLIFEKHFIIVEGAAALTTASFLKTKDKYEGKTVVLVVSGAKLSLTDLKEIFCKSE